MSDLMTDKIRKLLAMAEGGSTEQERATFLDKAQRLMIEHAVDEAMLRASGEKEMGTVNHRYWFDSDRQTDAGESQAGIADHTGCAASLQGGHVRKERS